MYAVVNHLPIKPEADGSKLAAKFGACDAVTRRAHLELISTSLIRASDSQAILVVVYRDRQSLDEIPKSVAAPWLAENMRPCLSAPVSRSVGEIVARSGVAA